MWFYLFTHLFILSYFTVLLTCVSCYPRGDCILVPTASSSCISLSSLLFYQLCRFLRWMLTVQFHHAQVKLELIGCTFVLLMGHCTEILFQTFITHRNVMIYFLPQIYLLILYFCFVCLVGLSLCTGRTCENVKKISFMWCLWEVYKDDKTINLLYQSVGILTACWHKLNCVFFEVIIKYYDWNTEYACVQFVFPFM